VTSLGARFDAWLTTPPEEPDILIPGDPGYPRCGRCGRFLKREPESVTTGELREHCDGIPALHAQRVLLDAACGTFREHAPHEFTTHGWDEQHRTCKGCGHDNITIDA
jgi:hypothetical protein